MDKNDNIIKFTAADEAVPCDVCQKVLISGQDSIHHYKVGSNKIPPDLHVEYRVCTRCSLEFNDRLNAYYRTKLLEEEKGTGSTGVLLDFASKKKE